MLKKERNICDLHDEIKSWATKICNIKLRNYENAEDALIYAQDYASYILNVIDDAKIAGEKMEARLFDYRTAIESLGFERNK
jgi:hypothetical protein